MQKKGLGVLRRQISPAKGGKGERGHQHWKTPGLRQTKKRNVMARSKGHSFFLAAVKRATQMRFRAMS